MTGGAEMTLGVLLVALAAKAGLLVVVMELVVVLSTIALVVAAVQLTIVVLVLTAATLVVAAIVLTTAVGLIITTLLELTTDVFVFTAVVLIVEVPVWFVVKLNTVVLVSVDTEAVGCNFIIDSKSPIRTRKLSLPVMHLLYGDNCGGDACGVVDVEVETELVVRVDDVLSCFSDVTLMTVAVTAEDGDFAPAEDGILTWKTVGLFVFFITSERTTSLFELRDLDVPLVPLPLVVLAFLNLELEEVRDFSTRLRDAKELWERGSTSESSSDV